MCSFVVPAGPGAAPRRAVRTAFRMVAIGMSIAGAGTSGGGGGALYGC